MLKILLFLGMLSQPDTVEIDSFPLTGFQGFEIQDTIEFTKDPQSNLIDAQKTIRYLDSVYHGVNILIDFPDTIELEETLELKNCKIQGPLHVILTKPVPAFKVIDSVIIEDVTISTLTAAPNNHQDNWGFHDEFKNKQVILIKGQNNLVTGCSIIRGFGDAISMFGCEYTTVEHCDINDAWTHGGASGTQGYGIDISDGNLNKVTSNFIRDTRHGIVIQDSAHYNSASGNVVSGSYALKKFWIFTVKDYHFTFDITLHGDGAHHNLIQSNNAAHRIYIDDEHPDNGPGNILYQNTAGNKIQIDKGNHFQYMISNKAPKIINKGKNNTVRQNAVIKWK